MLNTEQIKRIVPHRYPFLLVDKIIELEPGLAAKGVKAVSSNEPFFQGHFPEYAVMPGVLIIEALAQVSAIAVLTLKEQEKKLGVLAGIDKFKFRKQVMPGDLLILEAEILSLKSKIGKAVGKAKVGEKTVAEGNLLFGIVEIG
ncbi:MAG: hypothetical protein RLZ12_1063 [Bacillota bacterium]|jgi:3-hydroxyacyl-[acyl-carrier-protein] dehydratase